MLGYDVSSRPEGPEGPEELESSRFSTERTSKPIMAREDSAPTMLTDSDLATINDIYGNAIMKFDRWKPWFHQRYAQMFGTPKERY